MMPLRRVVGYTAIVAGVVLVVLNALAARPRPGIYLDFGSFWESGRLANMGADPYGIGPLTFIVPSPSGPVAAPNLNPPVLLPLFQWLAGFDPGQAFGVWWVLSLLLYLGTLALLARWQRPPLVRLLWAVNLAGLWHTQELGQVYVPLLLLAVVAWQLLARGHQWGAGALLGVLVALKPNLMLWPLALALAGGWLVGAAALATAGVVSLVGLVIYGPAVTLAWLEATRGFSGLLMLNSSLASLIGRVAPLSVGMIASALLGLLLLVWVWRTRPPLLTASALAIVTLLLATPISWTGYGLLLVPVLLARAWTPTLRLAAVLLCVPFWLVLVPYFAGGIGTALFAPFYAYPLLLVLAVLGHEAGLWAWLWQGTRRQKPAWAARLVGRSGSG
jgi:alpha-1,2-mannosyltransferase